MALLPHIYKSVYGIPTARLAAGMSANLVAPCFVILQSRGGDRVLRHRTGRPKAGSTLDSESQSSLLMHAAGLHSSAGLGPGKGQLALSRWLLSY